MKPDRLTVLLLDDDVHLCEIYKELLEHDGQIKVVATTDSAKARTLAFKYLFDVIILDARLPYRGEQYGGLQLADDLRSRYGKNSILVMSQFIKLSEIAIHQADYEFIDKETGRSARAFAAQLTEVILRMRARQFVFVAMPFHEQFTNLYTNSIRPGVQAAGFQCVRADELKHAEALHERLFETVNECKAVVFVADGANPNAYYEAGFADAMKKVVIIVARQLNVLKVDIQHRLAITYGRKPETLTQSLQDVLGALASGGDGH